MGSMGIGHLQLTMAQNWPACQEQNTVIRNAGQALFTNLQGYGATIGCFLDDCMSSDKFVAMEIESCAKVCFSLPECTHWVWGTEEGEQKCWFRTGDSGREAGAIRNVGQKASVTSNVAMRSMVPMVTHSAGMEFITMTAAASQR